MDRERERERENEKKNYLGVAAWERGVMLRSTRLLVLPRLCILLLLLLPENCSSFD